MNRTSESDLIDHVQVCLFCETGITFVPATIQWWRTTPDKRWQDPTAQRIHCVEGPDKVHRPNVERAVELERYRRAKAVEQIGLPYDASAGTLGP